MSIAQEKLDKAYVSLLQDARRFYKQQRERAKDVYKHESAARKLADAGIDFEIYGCGPVVNFPFDSSKDKATFSAMVTTVSKALGEPPEIILDGSYDARFPEHCVHVWMFNPDDCRLIEVEEIKKITVKKPHPSCVAALKVLEDIA